MWVFKGVSDETALDRTFCFKKISSILFKNTTSSMIVSSRGDHQPTWWNYKPKLIHTRLIHPAVAVDKIPKDISLFPSMALCYMNASPRASPWRLLITIFLFILIVFFCVLLLRYFKLKNFKVKGMTPVLNYYYYCCKSAHLRVLWRWTDLNFYFRMTP